MNQPKRKAFVLTCWRLIQAISMHLLRYCSPSPTASAKVMGRATHRRRKFLEISKGTTSALITAEFWPNAAPKPSAREERLGAGTWPMMAFGKQCTGSKKRKRFARLETTTLCYGGTLAPG